MSTSIQALASELGVSTKPFIKLPGEGVTVTDTATALYRHAGDQRGLFYSNGRVVRLSQNDKSSPLHFSTLTPAQAVSEFEKFANFTDSKSKSKVMPEATAKLILESYLARDILPNVRLILNRPLLILNDGEIDALSAGYNERSMVYVVGGELREPDTLEEAVRYIEAPLVDFSFKTEGDRSRAIALLLTPAFKIGGFITDHTPIDIIEASESQTGKGYLLHLRGLIYGERARLVVRQKGGTGSLDESISAAILSGQPFIQIDNLRGPLNSELLEAVLTNPGDISLRVPYLQPLAAAAHNRFFTITSNGVEITQDLANRASFIRLIKERDRDYSKVGDLSIEQVIRERLSHFGGAIAKVIRHYHSLGMPKTDEKRHPRREWAQTMDWIVQNIFELPPLLDGMEEVKERTVNPALGFVRELANQVEKGGKLGQELRCGELADIYVAAGLVLPGLDKEAAVDYSDLQVAQRIGQLMKQAMVNNLDEIVLEGYRVTRKNHKRIISSGNLSDTNFYCFELIGEPQKIESKAEETVATELISEDRSEPEGK